MLEEMPAVVAGPLMGDLVRGMNRFDNEEVSLKHRKNCECCPVLLELSWHKDCCVMTDMFNRTQ